MAFRSSPSAASEGSLRRLLRAAKTCIDAQEFPWLPPWHRGRDERERAVRSVRSTALRLMRAQACQTLKPLPPAALVLRALAWPLLLPIKAWQSARDPALPGFWRRFAEGCGDLARHNLRPDALRALRARRPDISQLAPLYVSDRENQTILTHLHQNAPGSRLGDKIAFDAFCREHGLPHIPILAHGVGAHALTIPPQWPAADLFAKAPNLWGGQGAEPLVHDPAAHVWKDRRGHVTHPEGLVSWAAETYGEQSWLIQPMLRVDPSWAAWSPGPLGTVRLVTVIVRPGDAPEIIAASMRLPRAGMVVDNFSAGALSAEIDWRSGRLEPALGRSGPRRWHDRHPDTGAAITGAVVPNWSALCGLACAAHAAAPDLVAVGWDLSCPQNRPVLLEANPVFNIAPTVILGETRWLEAIHHRLADLPPTFTTRSS